MTITHRLCPIIATGQWYENPSRGISTRSPLQWSRDNVARRTGEHNV